VLIGGAKQKAQKALREHMRDRLDPATMEGTAALSWRPWRLA